MKFILKIIGWVSALTLALSVGGIVLDHSLFNGAAVVAAAHNSGTCTTVAEVAPAIMTAGLNLPANYQTNLKGVVTGTYVCTKIDQFMPQLDSYYRSSGPAPQVDLTDLVVKLEGAGIQLPPAAIARLSKPLTYSNPDFDVPLQKFAKRAHRLTGYAIAIALSGIALTFLIGGARRWRAAAGIFFSAGVILLIEAGIVMLLPTFIVSPVASSPLVALAPAIQSLSRALVSTASRQLVISAVVSEAAAIVLLIVGWVLGRQRRRAARTVVLDATDDQA